ncbi:uncharacterized protein LAJ45_02191 [Morchella importuna]|uniref:uncharacterized protein n=1 Tax=Morchella importuna TaxID=1174673 RepID=UPI001E8EF183|nr:uncharacterized protein LAJ45_02191 [Morchella importuna]KAH8153379.1 hypothetical protein LAJ45_02191 [Morchella importuna]
MSFFKKLGAEFESFLGDKDEKKEKKVDKHSEATRSADQYGYPAQQAPSYSAPPAHNPYGVPPPHSGYGAPPMPQQYYDQSQGHAAPSYGHDGQAYYAPPPFPPPVPGPSQCPPGFVARFDENYKTWYYVNEHTRVSQWHHPSVGAGVISGDRGVESHGAPHGYYAAPPHDPHSGGHGYDAHSGGHGHDSHGGHGYDGHYEEHKEKKDKKDKKKDSGNTDMLVAGAAGLVIGGAAGALIAHEMTEDDNEEAAERAAEAVEEAQEEEHESSSDEEEEED